MAVKKEAKVPEKVLAELGNIGIAQDPDDFYLQSQSDLAFPNSVSTYDKMSQNVVVATALNATDLIASRTPFYFEAFDESKEAKTRKEFVESCFDDMTHTMKDFVLDCMTSHKYGFAIIEKVFRFRNKKYGSKFDDGLIGIKRLPLRHQSTISGWDFDKDIRELAGVYQKNILSYVSNQVSKENLKITSLKTAIDLSKVEDTFLARDRFLHIKAGGTAGNPEGKSPLFACYTSWRKLQNLLDTEEIACYKNLNGTPVLKIPAIYMSEDATPEQKRVAQIHKDGVTKLGVGTQNGLLLPSDRDENGTPYFDFKLESASASNITAISNVIKSRYDQIYQCLFADIMILGSGTSGAVKNKADMLNMLVESRLLEVCEQINSDLIPDLFRKNGWDDTKCPKIKLGKVADIDMAVYAKAMQQLKATKLVPLTPENLNFISEVFQLPYRFADDATQEEIDEILGVDQDDDSRSGDGLAKGSGNGTSDKVSEDDNSANNLENS